MFTPLTVRLSTLAFVSVTLLSACGGGAPTLPKAPEIAPNQPVGASASLSGKLDGGGANEVGINLGGAVLTKTNADANGVFTIGLPAQSALAGVQAPLASGLFKDVGCTGSLSDAGSQAQGVSFLTVTAGGKQYADATATRPGLLSRNLRGRAYLYADRDTALSGTLDCSNLTGLTTPVKVNLNVKAGWSALTINIFGSASITGTVTVEGQLQNGDKFSGASDVWPSLDTIKATMGR